MRTTHAQSTRSRRLGGQYLRWVRSMAANSNGSIPNVIGLRKAGLPSPVSERGKPISRHGCNCRR